MANKCLRRCLRSGLADLFFTHHKLHNMQELYPHHHHHPAAAPAASCSLSACQRRRLPACRSSSICLPQPAASSRFISSTAAEPSSHDDLQVDNLQHIANLDLLSSDGCRKLIRTRSHSCPKLQCRLNVVPSLKSLLHRSHSHGHQASSTKLVYTEHADEQEPGNVSSSGSAVSSPSCVGEYTTRSWSSPSLRTMKKAGSSRRSFHGELDVEEGRSSSRGKEKRAPKGHVAVYVEGGKERHVVPIGYLSHPQFRELLERAESEFGFGQKGGLLLPCSLAELQGTLHRIRVAQ